MRHCPRSPIPIPSPSTAEPLCSHQSCLGSPNMVSYGTKSPAFLPPVDDRRAVESRRGAPVERWREHGFRRPAPSHLCLALHFDYVSSPRSSNPACGFPALGSRSRSCARTREAAPSARSGVPDRSAASRPESARLPGLRLGPPTQPPTRPLWRPRPCPRPPPRGGPALASLPHVMCSAELCGVGQRNHCRATSSADLTPHKSCMGPARGDGTRQGLEAEPLPGRIPRGAGAAGLTLPSRAFVLQH